MCYLAAVKALYGSLDAAGWPTPRTKKVRLVAGLSRDAQAKNRRALVRVCLVCLTQPTKTNSRKPRPTQAWNRRVDRVRAEPKLLAFVVQVAGRLPDDVLRAVARALFA